MAVLVLALGALAGRDAAAEPPAPPALAAPAGSAPRIYIDDPFVRDAAHRALRHAGERLAHAECRGLLDDLANEQGEPLARVLESYRVAADGYLQWLVFYDGAAHPTCRAEGTLAFTTPGSRVVFLCGRAFARAWRSRPEHARVVVIHELLHSLGLGENPPSSAAINAMVDRRCWR